MESFNAWAFGGTYWNHSSVYVWIAFCLSICLLMDTGFWVLAVINKVMKNMWVQSLLNIVILFSLVIYIEVRNFFFQQAGIELGILYILGKCSATELFPISSILFYTMVVPVFTPTNKEEGFPCLPILRSLCFCLFDNYHHSRWCEVMLTGFWLTFPWKPMMWLVHLYALGKNVSSGPLPTFNWTIWHFFLTKLYEFLK